MELRMKTLPAAPLREIAHRRSMEYWQSIDDRTHRSSWRGRELMQAESGQRLMLKHYSSRYGISYRQADRDYRALQADAIRDVIADRWCVFLELHPILVWPHDWPLWDPMIVGVL